MSSDPNKRLVRILDAKTGLERLSEPVAVHAPRTEAPALAIPELPAATALTAEVPSEAGPVPVQAPPATVAAEPALAPQPSTPVVAVQPSEPSAP